MQRPRFQTIVSLLTLDQTPRVWSLLISVFGDLAQDNGNQISGPLLRQLTETIGIKPEAMRVALHRLRKEGWIESRRHGRSSVYFLTDWGRAQTVQASPRIYASGPVATNAWVAVFNPLNTAQSVDPNGVWVSSNILLTSQELDHSHAYVSRLTAESVLPGWMTDKVCSVETLRLAQGFAQALESVRDNLSTPLKPLEIVVLRVLVVHGWRRVVLKTPILPDYVFPQGWPGAACRASVTALLAQYPHPSLDELEASITSDQSA